MGKSLSLGTKVSLSAGALTLALLLTGWYGFRTISALNSSLKDTAQITCRKVQLAGIVNKAGSDMAAAQRAIVLYTYAKDPTQVAGARQVFQESSTKLRQTLTEVRPLLISPEAKQAAAGLESNIGEWISAYAEVDGLGADPARRAAPAHAPGALEDERLDPRRRERPRAGEAAHAGPDDDRVRYPGHARESKSVAASRPCAG
jgi:hypothetical protein